MRSIIELLIISLFVQAVGAALVFNYCKKLNNIDDRKKIKIYLSGIYIGIAIQASIVIINIIVLMNTR